MFFWSVEQLPVSRFELVLQAVYRAYGAEQLLSFCCSLRLVIVAVYSLARFERVLPHVGLGLFLALLIGHV